MVLLHRACRHWYAIPIELKGLNAHNGAMTRQRLYFPAGLLLLCTACSTPVPPAQLALDSGHASVVAERVVLGLTLLKVAKAGGPEKPDASEIFAFNGKKICSAGYQEIALLKNSADGKAPPQFAQLAKAQGVDPATLDSKIAYVLCTDSPYGRVDAIALIRDRIEHD